MKKVTPFSYKKGSSPLHRINAGVKLAFLLAISLAAFFPNIIVLSALALILIILSFVAGIGPGRLLRGSGPLLLVVIAVFVYQGLEFSPLAFSSSGLLYAFVFCARIAVAFSAASLLFSITTAGEIRKALSRLETFLHLERLNLGLYISLMLGFLPQFFRIWEDLNLAWKSRAGKNNISRLVKLIPLVIERMMIKAADTAIALEARNGACHQKDL